MKETMTPRERWRAALHLKPVDRLPFWPKLNAAYRQAQAEPFRNMELEAIHEWIGSDKHVGLSGCLRESYARGTVETQRRSGTERIVYRTPYGEMEMIRKFDTSSHSWHPVAFPVRSLDDVVRMTELIEDSRVEVDPERVAKHQADTKRWGESAFTGSEIGTTALMQWVQWLAGVEMGHYLLHDHPREVEGLFAAMDRLLKRKTELLSQHSPADALYLVENTSTTLISPPQYRRYCMPTILACTEIVRAAGRILILHMCGRLKGVLPDLAGIPVHGFEALTSPPLGDTTLLEGRTLCPDKCLIGGTHATLWTKPPVAIIAQIEKDLADLPHHRGIVVTSAGVMPPRCPPETIRRVCEWVRRYPARM